MRPFTVILFLLCAPPLSAQTLEEYRREVTDYSWQLKIAAENLEESEAAAAVARTGRLPKLSAAGHFALDARHRDEVKRWDFALEPTVVQTLYGGGGVKAAIKSTELEVDAAICEREFSRLEVRYAADYAYWTLSAAASYESSMREYVAIIEALKAVVDRRFNEGWIARGDVLMILTRLAEARYELVAAEQRCEVALHNFNILRGVEPSANVGLVQSIRDTLALPRRVTTDEVLARRPDYSAAMLRSMQAEVGVQAARAPYNPQLGISLGGTWQPQSPNRTGATRIDGVAQLTLSVPIFHFGERRQAVREARAAQRREEWAAAQLHDDIALEEINSWTALQQSRAQVEASVESLKIAGENLELGTYSYSEGMATVLDVLQAQLSWIQLYTNAIDARYAYAVAIADYERITAAE